MNRSLVSVVVPFHNHRAYVAAAVARLLAQPYEAVELILVDNNSTDGSGEIAADLASRHPDRVRHVVEPTQGIPNARNRGLAEARGDFVSFLDVDDEFAPTKLLDQVPILEARPDVAMVYGLTRRVYLTRARSVVQAVGSVRDGLNEPPDLAMDWLRVFYHLPQTGATLVRVDVARRVGGFGEALRLGNDDVAFHLKLAFAHRIWFERKEAVIYYRHGDSEGARINRDRGAIERYFDAYRSWVLPYAAEFAERTGDWRPLYWAERALVNCLARVARARTGGTGPEYRRLVRALLSEERVEGRLRGWRFRASVEASAWLPSRYATLASRGLFRMLSAVPRAPEPLSLRRSDGGVDENGIRQIG
jgi:glycosyltransferase involved in cell wall biosynthesis